MRALFCPFGIAVIVSTFAEGCGFYGVLDAPGQRGASGHAAAGAVLLTSAIVTIFAFWGTWLIARLFVRPAPVRGRRFGRIALGVVLAPAGFAGGIWLWARAFQAHFSVGQDATLDALERLGFGMVGGVLHGLDFAVLGLLWGLILAEVLVPPRRMGSMGARSTSE